MLKRKIKETLFVAFYNLSSLYVMRVSLLLLLGSAIVGALSFYYNSAFRNVILTEYGVEYTVFAYTSAISSTFLALSPIFFSYRFLDFGVSLESLAIGSLLGELCRITYKLLPIIIVGYLLSIETSFNVLYFLIALPFIFLLMLGIKLLLTSGGITSSGGNIISWFYFGITNLVSGLWFPVSALPEYLRPIAYITPQYHLVELIRRPLIGQAPPWISMIFGILFFAVSYLYFRRTIKLAFTGGLMLWAA